MFLDWALLPLRNMLLPREEGGSGALAWSVSGAAAASDPLLSLPRVGEGEDAPPPLPLVRYLLSRDVDPRVTERSRGSRAVGVVGSSAPPSALDPAAERRFGVLGIVCVCNARFTDPERDLRPLLRLSEPRLEVAAPLLPLPPLPPALKVAAELGVDVSLKNAFLICWVELDDEAGACDDPLLSDPCRVQLGDDLPWADEVCVRGCCVEEDEDDDEDARLLVPDAPACERGRASGFKRVCTLLCCCCCCCCCSVDDALPIV